MAKKKTSTINPEILDELLSGQDPATVLRSDGLLGELKKALAEGMLNAEMDVHLDSPAEQDAGNHRNGSSQKAVLSGDGALELSIPRDRHGQFDPALIAKYQRRFPGFGDTIIALYARGLNDVLIAVVDGLKGSPEAITAVFPDTVVQTCIVHLIRNSMQLASWKQRKALAQALKPIYQADNVEAAEQALSEFEQGEWGQLFPTVAQSWRRHWEQVIPFFAFAPEVRKMLYTNSIEAVHRQFRKLTKTKSGFPNNDSLLKLLFMGIQNASKKWTMPIQNWNLTLSQLSIFFEGRLDAALKL